MKESRCGVEREKNLWYENLLWYRFLRCQCVVLSCNQLKQKFSVSTELRNAICDDDEESSIIVDDDDGFASSEKIKTSDGCGTAKNKKTETRARMCDDFRKSGFYYKCYVYRRNCVFRLICAVGVWRSTVFWVTNKILNLNHFVLLFFVMKDILRKIEENKILE